jgi:hypothetical protein
LKSGKRDRVEGKMRKPMIVAVICALVGLCAPPRLSAARVEGGVKLGGNISFFHGADVQIFPSLDPNWVLRFGLCGGGFLALPFSENVAIQAEALITTKGSKEVGPLFSDYATYIYSMMITYLEIPVMVRLTTRSLTRNARIFFMAGPAVAFKLHSRFMRSGEVLDFGGVRSNDVGLVLSVGSIIRGKSYQELRYTAGLSRIIEEGGVPLNVKNGVFSLIVGYRF